MESKEIEFLIRFISSGLKVLSLRVAMLFALLLTFSLFAWVMYSPDYWRLAGAIAFALLVFLPIARQDSISREDRAVADKEG